MNQAFHIVEIMQNGRWKPQTKQLGPKASKLTSQSHQTGLLPMS